MVSTLRRGFLRLSRVLPTSRMFTSGHVNTETILHFFNKEYLRVKLKTNLMCSIRENVGWVRLYVCKLFLMSSKVLMKREYPPELWTRSLHREV